MDLPEVLKPWAAELAIFPRDLALSLGPLVRRLSLAIGPLGKLRHSREGEVDGFDGLTHRGSYERLLATEWLFADEAPEEFLRRAAAGEHTFLRIARPEPDGSRASVALFDAGPTQIGSPRIAHLATLIVLARRAAAAGASFGWGIIQDPEIPLSSEVSASAISRLLAARTVSDTTEATLRAWQVRTGGPVETDDLWLIGGARLVRSIGRNDLSCVVIEDVLDPAVRQVRAAVRVRARTIAEVNLDLPEGPQAARLLRDPFGAATAGLVSASRPYSSSSPLVFSANGFRIYGRGPDGGVVESAVPNSPRMTVRKPKRLRIVTRGHVMAIGRVGRSYAAVCTRDGNVEVLGGRDAGARDSGIYELLEPGSYTLPSEPGGLGPCYLLSSADGKTHELHFLDGHGILLRLFHKGDRRLAGVVAGGIEAVHPLPDAILSVQGGAGTRRLLRIGIGARMDTTSVETGPVFLGFGGPLSDPEWGFRAVGEGGNTFRVHHTKGSSRIAVPAGLDVFGVALSARRCQPGLLAKEPDGRGLVLVGQSWTHRLQRASSEIVHVTVSPAASHLAYTTALGEFAIYSLDYDAFLYRLVAEAR